MLDGEVEIASRDGVVHVEAAAAAGVHGEGMDGGAVEPGRITAQLLASALARAFATMPSGKFAAHTWRAENLSALRACRLEQVSMTWTHWRPDSL